MRSQKPIVSYSKTVMSESHVVTRSYIIIKSRESYDTTLLVPPNNLYRIPLYLNKLSYY